MRTTVMHDDLGIITGPAGHQVYTTLEEVLAAAGAGPARVVVAGPLTASASVDVPAGLTLEFVGDGALQPAAGVVVNILGHVFAPARAIFGGDGSVVFDSTSCVIFPGWWSGGANGVRIGKLSSDEVEVTLLRAGQVQADQVNAGTVQATSMSTTGSVQVGNRLTAVEVFEGSRRVGTDRVALAGDTMTGPLILYAMPEQEMEAAPRGYVLDIFRSFQNQVEQTNGFGIVILNGNTLIEAVTPMDVLSLAGGFGLTLTKGVPINIVDDEGSAEFALVDDEADAAGIGEPNSVILSAKEAPGSATLAAGDAIPCSTRTVRVAGDGGAVDLTSTPQVAAGQFDGQELSIVGSDDTNTVTLDDGDGLALVGAASIALGAGDTLALRWDEADGLWRELFRASM